jgi:hypothetical protein
MSSYLTGANIIVKGRLKTNIQFWIEIGAYDFIIDTIRDGYKMLFYSVPPSVCLSNNLFAMKHTDFVDSAIQDLLDRGLIVTCDVQPTVVNPLTVPIHSKLYVTLKSTLDNNICMTLFIFKIIMRKFFYVIRII